MYAVKLISHVLLLSAVSECFDPCIDHHYIYDSGGRSPMCPYMSSQCDRYITENWYKVVNYYGALEMPTSPVDTNSCGADFPVWLNGTYPTDAQGIVTMTACLSFYTSRCYRSYDIHVKNCSHFYVYYLRKTPGCSHRYCFGTNGPCPTHSTKSTSLLTTTMPTKIPQQTTLKTTSATTETSVSTKSNGPTVSILSSSAESGISPTAVALGVCAAFVIGGVIFMALTIFLCNRRTKTKPRGASSGEVLKSGALSSSLSHYDTLSYSETESTSSSIYLTLERF